MRLSYRPIDTWPGELTPDSERKASQFSKTWDQTIELLEREVDMLGPHGVRHHNDAVLQLAVPEGSIRQDGQLAGNAREPEHPGVILSFDTAEGTLRFACDRFASRWHKTGQGWRHNVLAIAKGLEALRLVERYGIGTGTEQYRGYQALPPGTAMGANEQPMTLTEAATVLASQCDGEYRAEDMTNPDISRAARYQAISSAFRYVTRTHHPDQGGDVDLFRQAVAARDVLLESVKP